MKPHMKPHSTPKLGAAAFKALQRITVAVRSQVDMGRVLDQLAADAGRVLDLNVCSIARWDDTGRALLFSNEYRRDTGSSPRLSLQGRRFDPAVDLAPGGLDGLLLREHRSLISGTPAARAAEGASLVAELAGSAFVVMPMVADQRPVGLMAASRPAELPPWSDDELEFVRLACDLAAVAVQHAALRGNLKVICVAAAELNSRLSLQDLLRRLTEAAMAVTHSTMGVAGVVEGDALVCHELRRGAAWVPFEARFRRDEWMPGWSWVNRAPAICNDAQADARVLPDLIAAHGVRCALTIPITNRDGEVVGFFELHNKASGMPYVAEDIHLATALAHHAALALEARNG